MSMHEELVALLDEYELRLYLRMEILRLQEHYYLLVYPTWYSFTPEQMRKVCERVRGKLKRLYGACNRDTHSDILLKHYEKMNRVITDCVLSRRPTTPEVATQET